MDSDPAHLSESTLQPQRPPSARSRRVAPKAFVLVYGVWLLLLPQLTSDSADRSVHVSSAPSLIEAVSDEVAPCCDELRIGRRRTLLRSLRIMAGLRDER